MDLFDESFLISLSSLCLDCIVCISSQFYWAKIAFFALGMWTTVVNFLFTTTTTFFSYSRTPLTYPSSLIWLDRDDYLICWLKILVFKTYNCLIRWQKIILFLLLNRVIRLSLFHVRKARTRIIRIILKMSESWVIWTLTTIDHVVARFFRIKAWFFLFLMILHLNDYSV